VPEQASEDAETQATVPSKDQRDSAIADRQVRELTDSSGNVEDGRETPLVGMFRIGVESHGGQIAEVPHIEAASGQSAQQACRPQGRGPQFLTGSPAAGARRHPDECEPCRFHMPPLSS